MSDISIILEDEVAGLGILVDLSEWGPADKIIDLAELICEDVALDMMPQIEEQYDIPAPTFIEVRANLPRSYGTVSILIRFSYKNNTCVPFGDV